MFGQWESAMVTLSSIADRGAPRNRGRICCLGIAAYRTPWFEKALARCWT